MRCRPPSSGRACPYLPAWTNTRRRHAARYRAGLSGAAINVPRECDAGHVYHLFVVRTRSRAALQAHLRARGIETLVHYPVPIPGQPALADQRPADCPKRQRACDEVLSLPMHPALSRGRRSRTCAPRSVHFQEE